MLSVAERVEKLTVVALQFVLDVCDVQEQVHSYNLCEAATRTHFTCMPTSSETLRYRTVQVQVEGRAYGGSLPAIRYRSPSREPRFLACRLLNFSVRSLRIFQSVKRAPRCFLPYCSFQARLHFHHISPSIHRKTTCTVLPCL